MLTYEELDVALTAIASKIPEYERAGLLDSAKALNNAYNKLVVQWADLRGQRNAANENADPDANGCTSTDPDHILKYHPERLA